MIHRYPQAEASERRSLRGLEGVGWCTHLRLSGFKTVPQRNIVFHRFWMVLNEFDTFPNIPNVNLWSVILKQNQTNGCSSVIVIHPNNISNYDILGVPEIFVPMGTPNSSFFNRIFHHKPTILGILPWILWYKEIGSDPYPQSKHVLAGPMLSWLDIPMANIFQYESSVVKTVINHPLNHHEWV